MKPRPAEFSHQRRFAFELLHVVLAELAQAHGVGFLNGFGGKDFGDCEQPNVGRIAPRHCPENPTRTVTSATTGGSAAMRVSFSPSMISKISRAAASMIEREATVRIWSGAISAVAGMARALITSPPRQKR